MAEGDKNSRKTKYFWYLLDIFKELEGDQNSFNMQISSLLNQNVDEMGFVLKCHLIIESYIDQYIDICFPATPNWNKARLSFAQKLELINHPNTFIRFYYPAIKSLNRLRNKFAHNLSYKIKDHDYSEIHASMKVWHKAQGIFMPSELKLLQDFTVFIAGVINTTINTIKRESIKHGLTGYLEWLNEMSEEVDEAEIIKIQKEK